MSFMQEAVREWAFNYGAEHPEQAWLLSNYDSWERNPHYTGPDVPHPEDYHGEDEDRAEVAAFFIPADEVDIVVAVPTDDIPF